MAVIQLPRRGFAGRLRFRVPRQVIHDEQVQQAIVVDVYPGSADCPKRTILRIGRCREPGFDRDVRKHAALVVVKMPAMYASDEDVFASVVVVVAGSGGIIVPGSGEAGLRRDIGEVSLSVILEEAVEILRGGLLERIDIRTLDRK